MAVVSQVNVISVSVWQIGKYYVYLVEHGIIFSYSSALPIISL